MSEPDRIARRISSLATGLWHPRYTRCKLKTDPLYDGVFAELEDSRKALLDIGCGLGILAMYLRERGWNNRVSGFDYDASKISGGTRMLENGGYRHISLQQGDARTGLPDHQGDVTILDIMQFFDVEEQAKLLEDAAERVAPGGKLIVRSGLKETSVRFVVTWLGDVVARCSFWMKAAPIHYPTSELFHRVLEVRGFEVKVRPLWGKTPFNNYLIIATRPE